MQKKLPKILLVFQIKFANDWFFKFDFERFRDGKGCRFSELDNQFYIKQPLGFIFVR